MTTKQDFAIGVLSITATILLVAVLLVGFFQPAPAQAYAQCDGGGDYRVATSQLDNTTELVYILDGRAERLNVYGFNINAGRIELVESLDVRWREEVNPPEARERGRRRR
jgi:hypothetical protein